MLDCCVDYISCLSVGFGLSVCLSAWASVSYHLHFRLSSFFFLRERERERSRYIYNVVSSHLVSSLPTLLSV